MSWLSEALKKLSVWWKKNNSIGDVIHNNETLVRESVSALVDVAWDNKANAEQVAKDCASHLLYNVLKPLPDVVESMVNAMLEPRIETFFKSAFTIKDIKTPEQATDYIMTKLKALK